MGIVFLPSGCEGLQKLFDLHADPKENHLPWILNPKTSWLQFLKVLKDSGKKFPPGWGAAGARALDTVDALKSPECLDWAFKHPLQYTFYGRWIQMIFHILQLQSYL